MYVIYGMLIYILIQYFPLDSHNIYYPGDTGPVHNTSRVTQSFKHLLKPRLFWLFLNRKGVLFFVWFCVKWPFKKSRGGGSLAYVNSKPKYLWQVYLHQIWSISLSLYVVWTCQLIHTNKHIRFAYFESRVAPPTVINRRIFITTFVSWPCFSFYCQYCHQQKKLHAVFIISLSSMLVLTACTETARKVIRLFSCLSILDTIFSPCAIDLWDSPKVRSGHGRGRGWRRKFEKSSEEREDEDTKMQSEFFINPAEENKNEDTKVQSILLTKPIEERRERIRTPLEKRIFE